MKGVLLTKVGHMELFGLLEWLLPKGHTGNQPDHDAVKGIKSEAELMAFIQSVLRPYLHTISILIGIADADGMVAFWWLHADNTFLFPALPERIPAAYFSNKGSNILELDAPDRRDAFQTTLFKNGVKEALIQPLLYQQKNLGFLCLLSDTKDTITASVQTIVNESAGLFAAACLQVLLLQLAEEYRQKMSGALPLVVHNTGMIGGAALQPALHLLSQVAPTSATVLLTGETGTGKELFAAAIHQASPRRHRQMVKVNCAALPAQLIESELFGHEKGAFTGALERRIGKFELADKGTLFLDEIGELPLELQAKLLRAIQEKEIERLGGNHTIKVDVRIIAATNRDLEREIAAGRFREDLYYRLYVFPIMLPPLRERKDDIPLLLQHFAANAALRYGKEIKGIHPACIPALLAYSWPGNIRELENVVERAVIAATDPYIMIIPPQRRQVAASSDTSPPRTASLAESERIAIIQALRQCNGKIRGPQGAAAMLDIKPTTLEARMKKLGIVKEHVLRRG
ncbi:AAA family ATPase [Chitinophaga silvisoli]|uniref:AAA family ATPase n=2 Tax=Chitinophaga silvisoli TaxID=2291814 RepID=A0A3E1P0E1_9BACT|nr:AAA family ATPase [Chitinophaga silvisoli]